MVPLRDRNKLIYHAYNPHESPENCGECNKPIWKVLCNVLYITVLLSWFFFLKAWRWINGSVVKSIHCSSKGLKFGFQHPYPVARYHLVMHLGREIRAWTSHKQNKANEKWVSCPANNWPFCPEQPQLLFDMVYF